MKVLFINQTFYPDVAATAQYLTDFAVSMAARGHSVTVLCSRRAYSEPGPVYASEEKYQGIRIIRVDSVCFGRKSRFLRVLSALLQNAAFAWRLMFMPRFDVMVGMTTPPLIGWTGLVFSRLKRMKFVYWVMDLNPDQAIRAGWLDKQSLQAKILRMILSSIFKHSKKIIVLDHYMKKRLAEKGVPEERVLIQHPWAHDEDLENVGHDNNPFRKEHKLEGKFVVLYSGNLSICHPVETLLKAALVLRDNAEIIFMFVGGGDRMTEVKCFAETHALSNLITCGYQPRASLKYSLSAADVHIAIMGQEYVGIVHPSKIYNIISIGRPFICICPDECSLSDIVCETGIGDRVNHGDVEALVQKILRIKNYSAAEKAKIKAKSDELKMSFLSQTKGTNKLAELIEESDCGRT